MADLEEYAIKRDRRFLVRLVVALLVGLAAGIALFVMLTSDRATSSVAETLFGQPVADGEPNGGKEGDAEKKDPAASPSP